MYPECIPRGCVLSNTIAAHNRETDFSTPLNKVSEPLYPPSVSESKFPYQIRMVRYKKSSSVIYAHFKETRISQSMDILVRDGEPKSRRPGSKSTTSFSRNTDITKSKSTNRYVTFFQELRRGIARRHASEQSWLKISQKVPTTLEHQGLRNSQNQTRKRVKIRV
jgi:hypothetical protein